MMGDLPIPIPVISKAEPWMGSNMDGFSRVGSRLDVGAIPMDPANAAARSDKISACYQTNQQASSYRLLSNSM